MSAQAHPIRRANHLRPCCIQGPAGTLRRRAWDRPRNPPPYPFNGSVDAAGNQSTTFRHFGVDHNLTAMFKGRGGTPDRTEIVRDGRVQLMR